MKFLRLLVLVGSCVPLASVGQDELSTQKEKVSYAVGVSIAQRVQQNLDIDVDALVLAIQDVLGGDGPRMTPEQIQATLDEEKRKVMEMQAEIAAQSKQAGEAFLAENLKQDGVLQTDSGLQYKVVEPGTGNSPTETDTVVVHYRGTLIDGTEFDSSYSRNTPATFPVNGVIAGWQEGLQLMKEGGKYEFYIPSELAYGEQGAGGAIGPNQTLVFEVVLQEIK